MTTADALKTPWVVPQEYGAAGDGVQNDCDAFRTANNQGMRILVPPGKYRIDCDLTLTRAVEFEDGAVLLPAAGATITLNGPLEAGPFQIFDTAQGGTIAFGEDGPSEAFPEWWGAKSDGQTDSQPAVQTAIDTLSAGKGGVLLLGRGHYVFGRTIFLRSFVTVAGQGIDTVIENNSTSSKHRNQEAFQLGNYDAAGTPATPHHGVSYLVAPGAMAGQFQITLANAQDADQFQTGDIVFLFNRDVVHDTETVTEFQQINKVIAISGATVTLEHPLYKDFDGTEPQVVIDRLSRVTSLGMPSYVAERASMLNLTIIGNGKRWIQTGGGYECLIENIWVADSYVLLGLQVCAYCVARNIVGTFTSRGIGTAYFTHDCVFDTAAATWAASDIKRQDRLLIEHHENSHHNIVRNVEIDIGSANDFGTLVSFVNASEFNVVENVRVRGDAENLDNYVQFDFTMKAANVPKQGNVARLLNVQMGKFNKPQVAISERWGTERKGTPNVIEDCVLFSPHSTDKFLWLNSGSDYEIRRIRTDRYGAASGFASPAVLFLPASSLGVRVYDIVGNYDTNSVRLQGSGGGGLNHPTPLVLVGEVFHASNAKPTLITQFVGGWVGKQITIQATNGNTTIQHGTNIFLKDGADKTLAPNETIRFVQFQPDRWDEV